MQKAKASKVREHYEAAQREAARFVEQEARQILTAHSNLKEFLCGMGSWYFIDQRGEIIYDAPKYITGSRLASFFNTWDESLYLTGDPMRFTATGPKITTW